MSDGTGVGRPRGGAAEELFRGPGEMARLMRATDWSVTPLGPVEAWSTPLRTLVGMVLANRFPMLLWWGRELVQVYNDGYRPILGDKHPRALGALGHEVWSEIWHIIGPMAEGILAGGPGTWSEHLLLPMIRKGFLEETYFTFSYSPVPGERGEVGGVLVTVQETTAQVLGERRLRTLQRIATSAALATDTGEAARLVIECLGEDSGDVPFALFYRLEPASEAEAPVAELASAVGLSEAVAPPRRIALDDADAPWPLGRVWREREPATVTLPGWDPAGCVAPGRPRVGAALCLPVVVEGSRDGFLVVGVSAALELDERYRSFLRLAAGHIASAIATIEAYAQERRRAEALAALDEAKTAFFANVSHEFRTPLTLMLGPLEEVLEGTAGVPPEQRGHIQAALRNARRLIKLVNALLAFSRLEAGRAHATFQPTHLGHVTAELASAFRSLVESAGLRFDVGGEPVGEPVWLDASMWETVVLNLVSNAFKFTLEGGVRVWTGPEDGHAVLVVEDTGVGIPPDELPRVFERFHRIEGTRGRSYEGTGIGLALVRELVHQHGGTIEVASEVGAGTRFTVRLPLGSAHLDPDHLDPRPAKAADLGHAAAWVDEASQWVPTSADGTTTDQGPPGGAPARTSPVPGRILVADDNADMRRYLTRILTTHGWRVVAVADGLQALEAARTEPPDLLLTDVMMPGLDGFGLMRELRADPRTQDVAVIVLSARAGEEAVLEGLGAGSHDYMVKPFSARELLARVEGQLARARLRQAESRHRAYMANLFRNAPVAIAVLRGPEHVFELTNPLYDELVAHRQLVGLSVRQALPELAGQGFYELLDRCFATGKPFTGRGVRVELMRRVRGAEEPSPEEVFLDFVYQPYRDDAGEITGIVVVAFETSGLVRARREAEQANRAKDEFLAMLAHELRNPMAAIASSLTLLGRGRGEDPARAARARDTAERQLDNLKRIVDDLLDLSRISRGHITLRREPADLERLVRDAITAVRGAIDARGHRLTVEVTDGPFPMRADATRIEQVATNLLTNAAKYTEPGGAIHVGLSREATAEGPMAVLRVRDTGRGLQPEMVTRVFDAFVQVQQGLDRSSGGLGLGLAVVKRLVEMHGGQVTAASAGLGQGSEFTVRLPLEEGLEVPAEGAAGEAIAAPTEVARARRVLLVEDNRDVRESLVEVIEDLGYPIEAAVDGPEGLARALSGRHDLALVDVGLPGMDGFEVARRVRAAPGGERLVMVALTGYGGPEARDKAREAGFDLHLTKPIDLDRLTEVLTLERSGGADG